MKCTAILVLLSLALFSSLHAQDYKPVYTILDETTLAMNGGTKEADPTADGGYAMKWSASATTSTIWYGPYKQFQGGNYQVQFRMKVKSNAATSRLFYVDIARPGVGMVVALDVTSSMFRNSDEWQLFTIPVQLHDNAINVEIRGLAFAAGITDL